MSVLNCINIVSLQTVYSFWICLYMFILRVSNSEPSFQRDKKRVIVPACV